MKSFLSYVVPCKFTEKELHHFSTALKDFNGSYSPCPKVADKSEKGPLN